METFILFISFVLGSFLPLSFSNRYVPILSVTGMNSCLCTVSPLYSSSLPLYHFILPYTCTQFLCLTMFNGSCACWSSPSLSPCQEGSHLGPTMTVECWQGEDTTINLISDNTTAMEANILTEGQPHYTTLKGRISLLYITRDLCSFFRFTEFPIPSQVYDTLH